jgi:DNA topoisomerase-3
MKIIIAEKPSVAKSIAAIVGANNKKDGYMEGSGYAVTWAFGHLVGLAMPEHYGIEGFKRENLPILPKEFKLLPRQVKEGKEYKNDPGVMKQLKIIRELFNNGNEIIVATDAGREGELIFRYIFEYIGSSLPFRRLWISSLTDRAIKDGFQTLRPGSDYDNLYARRKPAVPPIGLSALMQVRHFQFQQEMVFGRSAGCRPRYWRLFAADTLKTRISIRKPISV